MPCEYLNKAVGKKQRIQAWVTHDKPPGQDNGPFSPLHYLTFVSEIWRHGGVSQWGNIFLPGVIHLIEKQYP